MRNNKRVIAFLLAMSVIGAYSPISNGSFREFVAYAGNSLENGTPINNNRA